jgi:phytoene dehydrogenase-like protein
MSEIYDAIIIGAGHNGLVAAAYLAGAGQRVLVLERREIVGGAAVTEEIFPGFRFDTGAHRINRLHPGLAKDLQLADAGLEVLPCDPTVFSPVPEGGGLLLWRDSQKSMESIGGFSKRDAGRWKDFTAFVSRAAGFLESVYDAPAPEPVTGGIWETLAFARRLRGLGKRDMVEVMRVLPMTVVELLDEWFETDVLKGTLGAAGITGICQGPMAAGTAFLFLHHHVGMRDGAVRAMWRARGGIGSVSAALERVACERGVEIRTNAWVERIIMKDGAATSVELVGGEEIESRRIISNADPRHTLVDLLDPVGLDTQFLRKIRNMRYNGVCARVNLALRELPNFSSAPGDGPHLRGAITISPSLRYLERAYDDAKYGDMSNEPYLEAIIPSLIDPTLAPEGKHVMSVFVQYAPYRLKDGVWDDAKRAALGDRVVETLARHAPNIESAILQRQVLSPLDLEAVFGLTEGNIYHGEMTLDQVLFMRPVPGWSRYRTPVENLYLCGAGTHPGGGVTGAPGYHAARAVRADIKRKLM